MTIAITGATGFVGQAVLDEAGRRGLCVRALTRREQPARAGVSWVRGDLGDTAALAQLVQGTQTVIHIAGVVSAPDEAGFVAGNVTGTEHLVTAAREAGTTRLVHVSSLAAREASLSLYGHSKRLGEEIVQLSGLEWTIVRPPAVYGPRDTEIFELFKAARWGIVPMPPQGRTSIIHVQDLARLLLDLASGPIVASARILEPDDGRPGGWSHAELAAAIGRAMQRRVWAPHVPAALLAVAARADRLARGARAKLTPDRARYMTHPDWVASAEQAVPTEIWSPIIETEQGLAQTAKWYREHGWF